MSRESFAGNYICVTINPYSPCSDTSALPSTRVERRAFACQEAAVAKSSIDHVFDDGKRIKVTTECEESFPDAVAEVRQATLKSWSEAMHIAKALAEPDGE